MTVDVIPLSDLTQATIEGTGVFDTLMRSNKAHLELEFKANRIKGSEYATVYLGMLQATLTASIQFISERQKIALEAQLLTKQIALVNQQAANELSKNDNILKVSCKLAAEFDQLVQQTIKATAETTLLTQKNATERAQTSSTGVEDNSVIGKQKLLYAAQTAGFDRTSEVAAAKLMVDTWAVRRTTDSGTVADGTNLLNDATIGRAITKVLSGISA